jgi:hypothetical protein
VTIFIDDVSNEYVGRQLMMIILEKDKFYKNICTRPTHVIVENDWVGKYCFFITVFSIFESINFERFEKNEKDLY